MTLVRDRTSNHRAEIRTNQWHDYYRLPFGRCLIVSQQDYHRHPAFKSDGNPGF